MWSLGQLAYKSGKLPSDLISGLFDELTIYQFNAAILYFCSTVENALLEREPMGDPKKHETRAKYEFDDLLDDDFRMQRPPSKLQKRQQGAAKLLDLASDPRSGVKLWREKKPGEE